MPFRGEIQGDIPPKRRASGGARTLDLLITNQPLYRLSYAGPMDRSEKTGKEL